ncbi:MAG: sporulation integral membrane protein YtvI [Clostridia bacterium]|nr:sporulation integral membrane protein YtvI [Clostridia bacterium]
MKKERIELAVTLLVGVIAAALVFFVSVKYIFPVILPFLIGWVVALAVKRPAKKISERIHVSEKLCRVLTALLLSLGVFAIATVLLWQTVTLIWELLSDIGKADNPIYKALTALSEGAYLPFADSLPDELMQKISDALGGVLEGALSAVASAITSLAGSVPTALLFLLVTLISIIYFALDLEKINTRVRSLLPSGFTQAVSRATDGFIITTGKYLGSYLIIMLITFALMTVGFLILGVESPFIMGLILALFDLLPIIGVGTVLIPWSIVSFAIGDSYMGVGLILLFIVATVVRELAEPKIVGRSLGIHPLISLVLIYAGYALFGLYGLLLTPVIAAVIGLFIKKDDTAKVREHTVGE